MNNRIRIYGVAPEYWGYIPGFLDTNDPRSAREQINEKYISGWEHFPGFTLDTNLMVLRYPGDPPMKPLGLLTFRREWIYLYPSSWVLILQHGGSWEVARLD